MLLFYNLCVCYTTESCLFPFSRLAYQILGISSVVGSSVPTTVCVEVERLNSWWMNNRCWKYYPWERNSAVKSNGHGSSFSISMNKYDLMSSRSGFLSSKTQLPGVSAQQCASCFCCCSMKGGCCQRTSSKYYLPTILNKLLAAYYISHGSPAVDTVQCYYYYYHCFLSKLIGNCMCFCTCMRLLNAMYLISSREFSSEPRMKELPFGRQSICLQLYGLICCLFFVVVFCHDFTCLVRNCV